MSSIMPLYILVFQILTNVFWNRILATTSLIVSTVTVLTAVIVNKDSPEMAQTEQVSILADGVHKNIKIHKNKIKPQYL